MGSLWRRGEMKRGACITRLVAVSLALGSIAFAQVAGDIQIHPTCGFCGMDRGEYAHSRFVTEYNDGSSNGVCSIHCAAVDLALNIQLVPETFHVADYNTKELIDAESATWVVGGSKPGVMTRRAKWAYEKREDAQKFVAENGGEIATFDQAMRATYEDMYTDTKMINEKRKKGGSGHPSKGADEAPPKSEYAGSDGANME